MSNVILLIVAVMSSLRVIVGTMRGYNIDKTINILDENNNAYYTNIEIVNKEHRKHIVVNRHSHIPDLKGRIILLSKIRMEGCRDELVRLLMELSEYEDTSDFLDENPQIHKAIFHMAV